MKPSERIEEIASERHSSDLGHGVAVVGAEGRAQAVVDYLDEQHAKLSELRRDTKRAIEEARSGDPVMVVLEGWLFELEEFLGADPPSEVKATSAETAEPADWGRRRRGAVQAMSEWETADDRVTLLRCFLIVGCRGLMNWRKAASYVTRVMLPLDARGLESVMVDAGECVPQDYQSDFNREQASNWLPSKIPDHRRAYMLKAARQHAAAWSEFCAVGPAVEAAMTASEAFGTLNGVLTGLGCTQLRLEAFSNNKDWGGGVFETGRPELKSSGQAPRFSVEVTVRGH
jgi:hypothetical protein